MGIEAINPSFDFNRLSCPKDISGIKVTYASHYREDLRSKFETTERQEVEYKVNPVLSTQHPNDKSNDLCNSTLDRQYNASGAYKKSFENDTRRLIF